MAKNGRKISKANHGKRPTNHRGRWTKRIKTPRR